MIVNLHTHTSRCRHASGTEEEYVLAAIDAGLEVLGFSDHTPFWFPSDYYTHMRMFPEELTGYASAVLELRKKYKDRLEIPLGVEVEYYPQFLPELLPRLRDAGIEYMLLGQHWNGNEIGEEYNGRPTESEEKLSRYCNQVIEAMQTGLFTYLAHPDLLNFVGSRRVYETHMRRVCKEAKACNMLLEINLLGLQAQRQYPNATFLGLAAEEGCKMVLGSDAHQPQDVLNRQAEQTALELVNQFGLTLIERPEIRRI